MYGFSDPLSQAAVNSDTPGFEFYLWGQAAALNRRLSTARLVELLVSEAQTALRRASGNSA
jgi:hypothetical protein